MFRGRQRALSALCLRSFAPVRTRVRRVVVTFRCVEGLVLVQPEPDGQADEKEHARGEEKDRQEDFLELFELLVDSSRLVDQRRTGRLIHDDVLRRSRRTSDGDLIIVRLNLREKPIRRAAIVIVVRAAAEVLHELLNGTLKTYEIVVK